MTKMTTIPDNYNNIRAEIVELLKAAALPPPAMSTQS